MILTTNLLGWDVVISIYGWRNRGTERLINFLRFTQHVAESGLKLEFLETH